MYLFFSSSSLHIHTFVEFKLLELLQGGGKATATYFLQEIYKNNVYRKKNMFTMSNQNSSLNFCVSLEECVRQKLSFYSRTESNY